MEYSFVVFTSRIQTVFFKYFRTRVLFENALQYTGLLSLCSIRVHFCPRWYSMPAIPLSSHVFSSLSRGKQ